MDLYNKLKIENEELKKKISILADRIDKNQELSEKYSLSCSDSHKVPQYFINGKYVSKKNLNVVKKVAQLDYDKKVCKELEKELAVVQKLLQYYDSNTIDQIYLKQCAGRRRIVTPIQEPSDSFAKNWIDEEYKPSEMWEEDKLFYTLKGEKVRSKAEKIIADELNASNIPYRYEYPLEILVGKQKKTFRPDFLVLNRRTRKEYVIEHLGMMDKIGYYNYNLNKIGILEQNGYLLGVNLLILHETSDSPINILTFRRYVEEYLI